jgi:hypothetical protein
MTHDKTTENWQTGAKHRGKAQVARSHIPAQQSDGATSPERRTQSAPVDYNTIKTRSHHNMFHPLREELSQESGRGGDKIKEGSVSDASSTRGRKMRDPVILTPEILAMLDRHEPDKSKQAKLLTEHLSRQRTLPSTEEELQHHPKRKAKREQDIQLVAT